VGLNHNKSGIRLLASLELVGEVTRGGISALGSMQNACIDNGLHIYIYMYSFVVVDSFCITLFSTLEQNDCARM